MNKIKVLAICGEAGSGKDWLLNQLIERNPETMSRIISYTTRPPRENEKNGFDYHFVDEKAFTPLVLNGNMLEATSFNGWYYGTPIDTLKPDKINVGVFNPAGINILFEDSRIEMIVVQMFVDDKVRLIRQLNREERPNVAEIIRRYQTDVSDFADFAFEQGDDCIVDFPFCNPYLGIQDDVCRLEAYLEDRYWLDKNK